MYESERLFCYSITNCFSLKTPRGQTRTSEMRAMFDELVAYSKEKTGDIVIILLGGRGAQAMYKIINRLSETDEINALLARLHVFTLEKLESPGGIDILFWGFGSEAGLADAL